jgi:hypothetical protein
MRPQFWLVSIALSLASSPAGAYPGGTPFYVTDVAPFCTGCHSSASADQLAGIPENRVNAELAPNKHIAKIRASQEGSPYAKLTQEQREALIRGIEQIDSASSVTLVVPERLEPGQVFEATVTARGGGGPVVGVALVDAAHRWQARPAPSAGWQILEAPAVIGPNGQPQTRFLDGRQADLPAGISYVNVYGVSADPTSGFYSTVTVTYRLRAPGQSGTYPLGAVFLHGTERGAPHGAVETIRGKVPIGGFGGHGGRVRFSDVARIVVE